MKIKVVKIKEAGSPKVLGLAAAPERYHGHIQHLVNDWANVLDRFIPVSLNEMAERIRFVADSVDEQVDADLVEEYADMAEDAFSNQGNIWYQLEPSLLP